MKLPLNCEATYIAHFLSREESRDLYQHIFSQFDIQPSKVKTIDGKSYKVEYGKLMFIDTELFTKNIFPEAHWGRTAIWSEKMTSIKNKIERYIQKEFQVCVCIYYPDGNSGVDYHSDYIAFGDTSLIPSLSLGEERKFHLREKATGSIHELILRDGSLLVMGENCQENYEHALPVDPIYQNGRINLTFRQYGFPKQ